jgi:hypothetical protein
VILACRSPDFSHDLGKDLRKYVSQEIDLFLGATYLHDGFNRNDRELRWRGFERLSMVHPDMFKGLSNYHAELPTETTIHLPWIVSDRIKQARIVMWYFKSAKRFSPAIYRPDMATAIYVHLFLGTCGVCSECGKPFVAKKIGQMYCSLKHQNSYRNRRWRARKEEL